MRMSPWAVCDLIQRQVCVETTLHFPTRGRNLLRVQGDLLAAHALGVRNVFVVMGDPTEIGDYPDAMDDYDLVPSGLIKLIKQNFNLGIDHSGTNIGQPTSFYVGCALNLCPKNPERESKNLHRKLQAGALATPILVGVLPLYSTRHALFLHNEVPGINIPEDAHRRLREAGNRAPQEGVKIALELIEEMKSWASGVYLMPHMGRCGFAAPQ
jgi:homocysteine S-methyltransferase